MIKPEKNRKSKAVFSKIEVLKKLHVIFLFGAIFLITFSGCFSPWKGDEGQLIISLGNNTSRAAGDIYEDNGNFEHEIILDGPGGRISVKMQKGVTSASVKLIPGKWSIAVRAMGPMPEDSIYEEAGFPSVMLRALGYNDVTVESGKVSPATVIMKPATEVFNWEQLVFAFGQANTDEYILIANNISSGEEATLSGYGQNVFVTMVANDDVRITRNPEYSSEAMFTVNSYGSLMLGRKGMQSSLIIDGGGSTVSGPLFNVQYSASLYICDGAVLTNNNNTQPGGNNYGKGGAVYADPTASVFMSGGEIQNNKADNGGGIYMEGSPFTMTGGIIDNNKAVTAGGGLYTYGTIEMMNNSQISNNTCTDGYGGGIYMSGGSFYMQGNAVIAGNKAGNLSGTENANLGGGIYLFPDNVDFFRINGGTIYGKDATASGLANYPSSIAGPQGSNFLEKAQYGRYIGDMDWVGTDMIPAGDYSNETFRIVNGNRIQ